LLLCIVAVLLLDLFIAAGAAGQVCAVNFCKFLLCAKSGNFWFETLMFCYMQILAPAGPNVD
jgi:hypothetical protein